MRGVRSIEFRGHRCAIVQNAETNCGVLPTPLLPFDLYTLIQGNYIRFPWALILSSPKTINKCTSTGHTSHTNTSSHPVFTMIFCPLAVASVAARYSYPPPPTLAALSQAVKDGTMHRSHAQHVRVQLPCVSMLQALPHKGHYPMQDISTRSLPAYMCLNPRTCPKHTRVSVACRRPHPAAHADKGTCPPP